MEQIFCAKIAFYISFSIDNNVIQCIIKWFYNFIYISTHSMTLRTFCYLALGIPEHPTCLSLDLRKQNISWLIVLQLVFGPLKTITRIGSSVWLIMFPLVLILSDHRAFLLEDLSSSWSSNSSPITILIICG